MRNTTSSPPTALSNAVAAWNSKARAFSAPVLHHIFTCIGNLERLRAAIRQVDDVDGTVLIDRADGARDHAGSLENLCVRLDRLQETLARLNDDALAASREGESLVEAFLALPRRDASAGTRTYPNHTADAAEGTRQKLDASIEALRRLIDARNETIETLNSKLAAAEQPLASPEDGSTRSVGQIELQSVQEFVQNSPLASIPINASYYQRILEAASSPEGHKVPMGKILTAAGVVTDLQLQSALDYQRASRRRALGSVLVELGYTTEDAIAQALAAQLALPYIELANEPINTNAVSAIPVRMARRHACFPLNYTGHALCVAMANPLDLIALEDLRIASRNHIRPCVATRSDIARHIERYYV